MLPDYNTCRKHIEEFLGRVKGKNLSPGKFTFQKFWSYKNSIEAHGHNVLDEESISTTAKNLREYLIVFGMSQTGIAPADEIVNILYRVLINH